MADDSTRLPSDAANTGDRVDTTTLTVGADTVVRQRVQVAGGAAAELADVKNATPAAAAYGVVTRNLQSDGTNEIKSGSAANLAAQSSANAVLASSPGEWSVTHAPAVNTVATATKAAGAAGVRHICTGVSARIVAGTTAPAAIQGTLNLRDGASGAGSILASWTVVLAAAIGARDEVNLTGLHVVGTAATAMTLEFVAAGGANTFESVALFGHSAA